VFAENIDQVIILGRSNGFERSPVDVFSIDLVPSNSDFRYLILFHVYNEVAEVNFFFDRCLGLKQTPEDNQDNSQADPEEEASIRFAWFFWNRHALFLFPEIFYHVFLLLKTKLLKNI